MPHVPIVLTLGEANLWAKQACHRVHTAEGAPWTESDTPWSPCTLLSGKELRLSTACTGVDTPILAAHIFSKGVENVINTHAGRFPGKPGGLKIRNIHGCEKDGQCIEECLWSQCPPECLFKDMLDWLSPTALQRLKKVKHNDVDGIRDIILSEPLRAKAWCVVHGKECYLLYSDGNISGAPYVHHSSFGNKEAMQGKSNKVYLCGFDSGQLLTAFGTWR